LKVTREKTENSQAFLTVEMDPADVEAALGESYYRLVKKTNIPGFRKGKAPRSVLERTIGRESLLQDALSHLIPKTYEQAIKEQKIDPLAQPHIEVTQTDPVVFKATVPMKPSVKLGDYHSIRLKPEAVKFNEVDVDVVVENLRHQQATWEPVARPVDFGDLVVLDIESNIEGKPFIDQKGVQYQLHRGSPFPLPGFAEQLAGMKRDEEKEFTLKVSSDYPRGELAGKESHFKVKVGEIKQEKLPKLNNSFAKQVNPEIKTLTSLRKLISANLKLRAEEKARADFEEKVVAAVADLSQVEFPPLLVEMEVDRLLDQRTRDLGGGGLEEYLKSINKTEAELRKELEPPATKRAAYSLVLERVAEEEKIEVGDGEIEAEIEEMMKNTGGGDELRQALSTPQSRQSIKQLLTSRKTIQHLVEIAKGATR